MVYACIFTTRRTGALPAVMAQKPKNQAGPEQKRQDRYPEQYRAHDGERDHGDDDTDKQHEERQANRPEPRHIEALGGARGRCISEARRPAANRSRAGPWRAE